MRILSPWRDYYDYIGHQYGGGDPSILYLRKRLKEAPKYDPKNLSAYTPDHLEFKQAGITPQPSIKDFKYSTRLEITTKWLAVCGRYYLLINVSQLGWAPKWEILDKEAHPKEWDYLFGRRNWHNPFVVRGQQENYLGKQTPELLELTKKVGTPVFTFTSYRGGDIIVDSVIPNLGELGFQKFLPPEQMYQELAYFIVNTMKDSPDMMPPTVMSDKEKISQHGFDPKQSFRHRK